MKQKQYLLDTNICIFYMKGKYNLIEHINDKVKSNCYISEITVAELYYGATCSNRKEEVLEEVKKFVSQFSILPVYRSLLTFAEVKAKLRTKGLLVDDFDLLIGATAIVNGLVLVTENVKHFERIPQLKIENWITR